MTYQIRNIVIAAVLAVIAGLLVTFYLVGQGNNATANGELVTAYVASKDIPTGAKGADVISSLEETQVTADAIVPGAITEPAQIEKLIASQPVYKGEQITTTRFNTVTQQGIQGTLTGKNRAVQVPGDHNQLLAGTLRDGDHVDVVARVNYRVTDLDDSGRISDTRERTATKVVLRDLTVLQAPAIPPGDGILAANNEDFSVVLQVTDEQAETLVFVTAGDDDWTLDLRPLTGAKDSAPGVETIESLLGAGLGATELSLLTGGSGVVR